MRLNLFSRRDRGLILALGGKRVAFNEFDYSLGHRPPDFQKLYEVYTRDVDVYSAVNALAYMTVGVGIYVESSDPQAKQVIDKFNKSINLDEKLFTTACELIYAGNSFWYKVYDGKRLVDLQHIPPTRVKMMKVAEDGTPQKLVLLTGGRIIELNYDQLIHFYLFRVDKELFGSPLIRPIIEERTDSSGNVIQPLYRIKWEIEDFMYKVIRKYPPRFHYKFDVSDEKLQELADTIANLRPGEDLVTNMDFKVESLSSDPASRFSDYIKHLDNKLIIGLMTITHRLFTAPGFTEASANVAMDLQQLIIKGIQRKIKREVEKVYDEVLRQSGIEAEVRLNFGEPTIPELEYDHIARFLELGAITYGEARKMLADKGWPIQPEERAGEALRPRQMWVDTPDYVYLMLVDPEDVDYSTIRYYSIDSEAGIRMAVAWIRSEQRRLPAFISFNKSARDWTVEKAKEWYRAAFPQAMLMALEKVVEGEGNVGPGPV